MTERAFVRFDINLDDAKMSAEEGQLSKFLKRHFKDFNRHARLAARREVGDGATGVNLPPSKLGYLTVSVDLTEVISADQKGQLTELLGPFFARMRQEVEREFIVNA